MSSDSIKQNPMRRVLSVRDFRLLFAGSATSLLGDQFAFIATPWLVLKLTGDPAILGIVLALEGFPRAIFMLLGGAVTDRLSPRLVMLFSDFIRLVLTAMMAFAIFTGTVQVWMLYAFGLGFGLVAGFAIPAQNSIVPLIVQEQDLQAGNSLMMGLAQLAGFIGPTVAGIIIGKYAGSLFGVGLSFGLDSVTFLVSAGALLLIRSGSRQRKEGDSEPPANMLKSIGESITHMFKDGGMRLMFLILVSVNFLLIGPLLVGIPIIADQRLPEGAVAFGMLMSAFAGGNLGGYLIAGAAPKPSARLLRVLFILLIAMFGTVIAVLPLIPWTWLDFALLLLLGLGNGYISILMFTWIQTTTPKEMLGRVMGLLMLASAGLVPVSQAISGFICKLNLNGLFITAGALAVIVAIWSSFQPGLKTFSEGMSGSA